MKKPTINMTERKFGLGVIIHIFNRDFSKIFLLKRNKEKRKRNKADWGNVGGRVEFGEKLIDACLREAKEEIGVDLNPNKLKLVEIKETPFLTDVFHAIHFVYVTNLDENEKICLNFNCDNESDDCKWFDLKKLPQKMLDKEEDIIKIANKVKDMFKEE
jgi:ADP-ribose pyrophosphatase YjhB (NUDIX family)